jgi:hypothetical protein
MPVFAEKFHEKSEGSKGHSYVKSQSNKHEYGNDIKPHVRTSFIISVANRIPNLTRPEEPSTLSFTLRKQTIDLSLLFMGDQEL